MYDLHALLKLLAKDPLIEKYQGDKLPDSSKLDEVSNELKDISAGSGRSPNNAGHFTCKESRICCRALLNSAGFSSMG